MPKHLAQTATNACLLCFVGRWYNSIIFDKDWFGSALGSPENDFMVSEGRFGNISTIYDPEKNIAKGGVKSNHNAYGYVTSTRNYQVRAWIWIG